MSLFTFFTMSSSQTTAVLTGRQVVRLIVNETIRFDKVTLRSRRCLILFLDRSVRNDLSLFIIKQWHIFLGLRLIAVKLQNNVNYKAPVNMSLFTFLPVVKLIEDDQDLTKSHWKVAGCWFGQLALLGLSRTHWQLASFEKVTLRSRQLLIQVTGSSGFSKDTLATCKRTSPIVDPVAWHGSE